MALLDKCSSGSRWEKPYAKGILILYAFITVTFPLAHKDFVPLDVKRAFSPIDSHSNSLDSSASDFVCPAHNFAQSTTGTAALAQDFPSPKYFCFVKVEYHDHLFAAPGNSLSPRAPPQA